MNDLSNILNAIEPISLKEMDGVKLMDRTDTKFIFSREQLGGILTSLAPHYRALSVDGKKVSAYKTLYYDTSHFNLYLAHHNGELNRYKIRHRSYVESGIGFLEVKFKSNKGRTIKERIKQKEAPKNWEDENESFLSSKTPFKIETLIPSIWVNYSRITLVSKLHQERVTIDLDLEFIRHDDLQNFGGLVIAEVKQGKKQPSEFLKLMKSLRIREGSISKYCMGIAITNPEVKKNNFKEKLLHIKQIIS